VIEPASSAAARSGLVSATATTAGGSTTAAGSTTAGGSADPVSRGFEQLLVQQLAKELLATTGDTGNAYASMLPDALASAVEDGGGLGLDLQAPRS
jgi:hypothetical protein